MHAHWIRRIGSLVAGIVLAILIKAMFSIPILTTIMVIGIIYLLNRQFGAQTAKNWTTTAARVIGGLVVFLALRLLAAKLLGLYPVDTYPDGNLYWTILCGHDIKNTILWEICFAFIAGGLSVRWAQGKNRSMVGAIFGFSLLILSVQIALPEYAEAYPNKHEVSATLVNNGVIGAGWEATKAFLFGGQHQPSPTSQSGNKKEALVLESECDTPCGGNIPENFKIRTERHPLYVKSNGESNWVLYTGDPKHPGEGNFQPISPIHPGWAEFKSDDGKVHVQIYERVTIPQ
jgi:hypothetical protein